MPDVQKVVQTKDRIMETIKIKGPTYPAQIARQAGLSPLFTAAFLSELVKERKLKLSNMKVGSSPIYFIPGQENQLENFTEYLNHKEKEAFQKIKEEEMLQDEEQEPAIRVALRKIKDFAIPVQVRIDGETKLFWRYFQFQESETRNKIRELLSPQQSKKPEEKPKEEIKPIIEQKPKPIENQTPIQQTPQQPQKQETLIAKPLIEQDNQIKPKPIKKLQTSEFAESIKDYLAAKEIEILQELSIKKKEFTGKVRIDTLFGKQGFYLIAKDKKKVNQDDLTIAIQTAQTEKMPALFISPGSLDKNASTYLEEYKNLIKFDKVKI